MVKYLKRGADSRDPPQCPMMPARSTAQRHLVQRTAFLLKLNALRAYFLVLTEKIVEVLYPTFIQTYSLAIALEARFFGGLESASRGSRLLIGMQALAVP